MAPMAQSASLKPDLPVAGHDPADLVAAHVAMEHGTMSDDELMAAYANGDVVAFNVLYGRHEGALFRFVRRLLGGALAMQVDEVFQDTWLRIVDARDSFLPQGATWRTWAFTIAHNLSIDRLRVNGREWSMDAAVEEDDSSTPALERALAHAADGAALPESASAEDAAYWRAAGRRMLACLDELPVHQRAAFLLHHEDGFTVEAVAAMLKVGFETARSRLRYALKKLRGCMGGYMDSMREPA